MKLVVIITSSYEDGKYEGLERGYWHICDSVKEAREAILSHVTLNVRENEGYEQDDELDPDTQSIITQATQQLDGWDGPTGTEMHGIDVESYEVYVRWVA